MTKKKIQPRATPTRDERYMGLAWIYASFSKDPTTQVGSQIVTNDNKCLGAGYNGPPDAIDDDAFSWCRPDPHDPKELSKYDVVTHSEINAIHHSDPDKLPESTIYVTGFPCKHCMLEIVGAKIARVVYMEFVAAENSMLNDPVHRAISEEIAKLGGVKIEKFSGNLGWLADWINNMQALGLCSRQI